MDLIEPRRLKGFRDLGPAQVIARDRMISQVRAVYERFGFVPLETPTLEYVDVLGKFLPESDQPDAGIFAFRDEDQEWIALRYDLTAPLSRFVAMNPQLPLPFRRYQAGSVFRVDKPGPGRFREFYQFDVDIVGSSSMLADAEVCFILAKTLESLGIQEGLYSVRVNNRKVLNGVMELISHMGGVPEHGASQILRAIDKLDRVGAGGVAQLLGRGRRDESGDVTPGVGLSPDQIDIVNAYLGISSLQRGVVCQALDELVGKTKEGAEGISELRQIDEAIIAMGDCSASIVFDPTVVRGLAYYTGPVFEAVLTFDAADETGAMRQFGSVAGGGRYDDLIRRFTGKSFPATGASLGVDRLLAALAALQRAPMDSALTPVLVTRLDPALLVEYQKIAALLRKEGINTEVYVGTQGIGKQFKYAADSGKIVAVILGEDERRNGSVSLKDLRLGAELALEVGADRKKWLTDQPAQMTVPYRELVPAVRSILARYALLKPADGTL